MVTIANEDSSSSTRLLFFSRILKQYLILHSLSVPVPLLAYMGDQDIVLPSEVNFVAFSGLRGQTANSSSSHYSHIQLPCLLVAEARQMG